jgi:hypothetical protein
MSEETPAYPAKIPLETTFKALHRLNSAWVGATVMYNLFNDSAADFKCVDCGELHHEGWVIDSGGKASRLPGLRYTQIKTNATRLSNADLPPTCYQTYSCNAFLKQVRLALIGQQRTSVKVTTRYPQDSPYTNDEITIHVGDDFEVKINRPSELSQDLAPTQDNGTPTRTPSQGLLQRVLTTGQDIGNALRYAAKAIPASSESCASSTSSEADESPKLTDATEDTRSSSSSERSSTSSRSRERSESQPPPLARLSVTHLANAEKELYGTRSKIERIQELETENAHRITEQQTLQAANKYLEGRLDSCTMELDTLRQRLDSQQELIHAQSSLLVKMQAQLDSLSAENPLRDARPSSIPHTNLGPLNPLVREAIGKFPVYERLSKQDQSAFRESAALLLARPSIVVTPFQAPPTNCESSPRKPRSQTRREIPANDVPTKPKPVPAQGPASLPPKPAAAPKAPQPSKPVHVPPHPRSQPARAPSTATTSEVTTKDLQVLVLQHLPFVKPGPLRNLLQSFHIPTQGIKDVSWFAEGTLCRMLLLKTAVPDFTSAITARLPNVTFGDIVDLSQETRTAETIHDFLRLAFRSSIRQQSMNKYTPKVIRDWSREFLSSLDPNPPADDASQHSREDSN